MVSLEGQYPFETATTEIVEPVKSLGSKKPFEEVPLMYQEIVLLNEFDVCN